MRCGDSIIYPKERKKKQTNKHTNLNNQIKQMKIIIADQPANEFKRRRERETERKKQLLLSGMNMSFFYFYLVMIGAKIHTY